MANQHLSVYIRALWDPEALEQMKEQLENTNWTLNINARTKDRSLTTPTGSDTEDIENATDASKTSKDTKAGAMTKRDIIANMLTGTAADDMSEEAKKQTKWLQVGQEVTAAGIKGLTGITQGSFQFLEMIYNQLKSASPLLQTIESLFNLAVQLFFMPLGNKLAEVMIPAVIELVDNVVEMWDAMEGMSISQIIETMMTTGVQYFGQFFQDIGAKLSEQGGLVGAIGELLSSLGDFLMYDAAGMLQTVIDVVMFVVDHLKEIISLIAAFYAMQYAMQIASMYVNATGQTVAGKWLGAGVIAAGVVTGALAYYSLDKLGLAEGGYVPATEGGQVRILGEGGEGEYVIPESKMNTFGGTTNYYYFNGYTDEDVLRMIRDEVSSQISQSRIRGSF